MKRFKNVLVLPKKFFKTLYIGFLFGFLPFNIIIGFLGLIGERPVIISEREVSGILALIVSLGSTPFMALFTAFPTWLILKIGELVFNSIFWIYEKFSEL